MICCVTAFTEYVALMDWQRMLALSIVAITALIMAWGWVRRRKFTLGRETHCGCGSGGGSGGNVGKSIVFRARKGERPEVLVQMK